MAITFKPAELSGFSGSEHHYRHGLLSSIHYTDGVHHIYTNGCAWLVDLIASQQFRSHIAAEPFQVWTLTVEPDQSAQLTCDDGNGKIVFTQKIRYTDFPADERELKLYAVDKVILLPSEY